MSEWKTCKLSEIGVIVGGATPSTKNPEFYDGNIPWITPKDLTNWSNMYISKGERSITKAGYDSASCKMMPKGSVLFTSRAPIGYIAIAANEVCTNQGFKSVVPNTELIDSQFLYYSLIFNKNKIIAMGSGTTFAEISGKVMANVEISLPPLDIQKKIAAQLSEIDDKITVNKKICENLEAQAQALFKHWLVDFAPFKDGKFVESVLGLIPEGWRVGKLTEIADYLNGLAMQKFPPLSDDDAIPVLKIKELGQSQCDNSSDKCSKQIKPEYIIKNGDVVFSWSGTLMIDIWCGGICGLNQHLFKVTSDNYPKWFYLMWTKHHLAEFIRIAKDKAVTMGHIIRGDLEKAQVAIPDSNTLDKMSEVMNDIFDQIINTRLEINTISTLRDTLLPKLMSGEIKV